MTADDGRAVPDTEAAMPDNVRDAYLRLARHQCPAMQTVYDMAARSTDFRERRAADELFSFVAELMARECDHMPGDHVPADEEV